MSEIKVKEGIKKKKEILFFYFFSIGSKKLLRKKLTKKELNENLLEKRGRKEKKTR